MNNLDSKFNLEKPSILYVDDERDNLTTFKSVFRRDYDVSLAISGEEGIEILKAKRIDLIITDQRMPQMTGVEFLKNTLPHYPDLVRMILTGFSDMKDIIDAINSGKVYAYITKPWHKDELKITIDNALNQLFEKTKLQNEINALKSEIERLRNEIAMLHAN